MEASNYDGPERRHSDLRTRGLLGMFNLRSDQAAHEGQAAPRRPKRQSSSTVDRSGAVNSARMA